MLADKWDGEFEKLEKLCEQNSIEFHIEKSEFPVRFIFKPLLIETRQLSLIENRHKNEILMEFIFGEDLMINFIGDFHIDDEILNKVKNLVKKLHYIWLQIWFKGKNQRWESSFKTISKDENGKTDGN